MSTIQALDIKVQPLLTKFPEKLCRKYPLVPIKQREERVWVLTPDPHDLNLLHEAQVVSGFKIEALFAEREAIQSALDEIYLPDQGEPEIHSGEPNQSVQFEDVQSLVSGVLDQVELVEEVEEEPVSERVEAPIIQLVNGLLVHGIKIKASDIHIEPFERYVQVRFRLDGTLQKQVRMPLKLKSPVLTRIKVMSNLDIAEKRLPQDGRIRLKINQDKAVDFRVSTLPSLFGEKLVLRILDRNPSIASLDSLGLNKKDAEQLEKACQKPWGLVLVTGPTGSGKTTTLYAALKTLDAQVQNIMTVEDPIEYQLNGICQVQTHNKVGLTFPKVLKSFLRQDPDVLLVGETRDGETANMAVRAAMTGHLVLSSLHCNNAASAVARLVHMGVEPFLIASTLHLALAQRLVRVLCSFCKEKERGPVTYDVEQKPLTNAYKPKGCARCNQGFSGRNAVAEVFSVGRIMRNEIVKNHNPIQLARVAKDAGMVSIWERALHEVRQGQLWWREAIRLRES